MRITRSATLNGIFISHLQKLTRISFRLLATIDSTSNRRRWSRFLHPFHPQRLRQPGKEQFRLSGCALSRVAVQWLDAQRFKRWSLRHRHDTAGARAVAGGSRCPPDGARRRYTQSSGSAQWSPPPSECTSRRCPFPESAPLADFRLSLNGRSWETRRGARELVQFSALPARVRFSALAPPNRAVVRVASLRPSLAEPQPAQCRVVLLLLTRCARRRAVGIADVPIDFPRAVGLPPIDV